MHQRIAPVGPSDVPSPLAAGRAAPETKSAPTGLPPPPCPPVPPRVACAIVRQLVLEVAALLAEPPARRRDGRRQACHTRQIAMYVCHVVLRLSLSDIGLAFGRDRTTAGHACNVVEDRRDDAAFDAFVASVERIVLAVFGPAGLGGHD
jgi:hypothetical protein